jgi:hypothetical protein
MFLICPDRNDLSDSEFSNLIYTTTNKKDANRLSGTLAARYGRGNVYRLVEFRVPPANVKPLTYLVNEKDEVIPCD